MRFLNQVFYNISETRELRQIALQSLVSWKPDSSWWHHLASASWHEPSRAVRSYIYTIIKSTAYGDHTGCDTQ